MSSSDWHEVELTTHTYGGDSLGRLPDGRAVFVPFSWPGETVRVRLVEEKRGFARAELLEVIQPAPERIEPRCKHFGRCGGCHYQHMPYEAQLEAKAAIVSDQLTRIGKIEDPPVQPTVPSPLPVNYRNYVQFALTPEGALGYHEAMGNEVFRVEECYLPESPINQVWPLLDIEGLPDLERVGLRVGQDEDVMVTLESSGVELPELSIEELPLSVVHLSPAGGLVLGGSDHLVMEVLEREFQVSAGSFFQVNTPMAAALVEHLLAELEVSGEDTVVEGYAGVGLFSAFLAQRAGRLIAVEESAQACDDFEVNLEEFENVDLYEGAAQDVLPVLAEGARIIVVDPPRTGLHRYALDAILELSPQLIAYVSCDPATLARDARRLVEGGYSLQKITPFDLFPQTYHIETVSLWRKQDR